MNMSVFSYQLSNTNGRKMIVHLFHDLNHKKVNEKILTDMVGMLDSIPDVPPEIVSEMGASPEALTRREGEILTLLAKGHGTQDIADLLSISLNTVRNHIQHILQKFQVHTRLEAVAFALKHDLIG
jgi:NarL family two-component system response regulator LiaR